MSGGVCVSDDLYNMQQMEQNQNASGPVWRPGTDHDLHVPRAPPPIVGKVTHYSIDLYWDEALEKANAISTGGKVKVSLQERDKHNQWGSVFTGYSKSHTVHGLETQSKYCYRIRFLNDVEMGEWSPHTEVSTTKEPLHGEHLHKAITLQDTMKIQEIIDSGDVDIDVPDKYGFTGLMQAAQRGYLEVLEKLLECGADVNYTNDSGKTALMLACFSGHYECGRKLREEGAKYHVFDKGGSSPIHWAVDGCNTRLLDWMIKDGADVNMRDTKSGWTPLLRCASVTGNRDVALSLVTAGAELNVQDKDGKTALMVAIINGHQNMVELLLKKNADLSVKNTYGKTAYDMAHSMERRRIVRTLDEHITNKGIKIKGLMT